MGYFVIKELEAKKPEAGIEIRVIPGQKMTMAFFRLEAGGTIPEHSHPHEQMGTVLKGSVELIIDNEKRVVEAGMAYHVPPDVAHSGHCLESPAEVLEAFSPRRDDLQ